MRDGHCQRAALPHFRVAPMGASAKPVSKQPAARRRKGPVDKYECMVCGYVYDPAKGDPDAGIPPGTPFADLPEDWVCPDCGAEACDFEKIG